MYIRRSRMLTILAVNLRSSSSRSLAVVKAVSLRGGLYMLKNNSGERTEKVCASVAEYLKA